MDDRLLLDQFQSCRLPFEDWCHRLHVRLAYLFLRRDPFDAALNRFRAGIQAYNQANQVPEQLDSGYHETLTVGWLHLIAARMDKTSPRVDSDSFCNANPDLLDRFLLREFYSVERIRTLQAKREFVEPDRRPLRRSAD